MSKILTVSFSGSSTRSWQSDGDYLILGTYYSGTGIYVVSTDPNIATTVLSAPTAGNRLDIIACGSGSFRVSGAWAPQFPISNGEVVYFAVSVLGVIQLILEPVSLVS